MKAAFIYTIILGLLLFYLIFGHNGIIKYNEMLDIQARYEAQISEMDEKIVTLEREIELLKQDRNYMEHILRKELGLQKSDEDQYILPEEHVAE